MEDGHHRRPVFSVEFRVGTRGVDDRPHARDWHHHRPMFKITKAGVLREWLTTAFSLGLLSFYSFALITSPSSDRNKGNYKLLAGYVIMSAYMRLCYILQTLSKTYVLYKQGECEVPEIPMQTQIGIFCCLMCLVEPGHFICLCWITHVAFPLRPCHDLSYWATCASLHISSTVFVSLWILTFLAVFVFFGIFFTGQRFRRMDIQSTLQLAPMPDAMRSTIIENLPLSDDPPPEGEVCAFCLEREGEEQWRVLPCEHRFHAKCVDDWLINHRGACPICRQNPVTSVQNAAAAAAAAASTPS
eukprot:CAMPEP_0177693468 /NCGR_PEP_ID=MMETSP0484_2-20121128/2415_1 /TAXON_ID=354590 /ORGANISM="Rhodomonas lens, Strain RHODO" /LENGTH=300 /DNA_ID=CAMNT_0019204279 /DNA_START=274 /DNA_END=1173 /DNA_ORIENTATION=+